MPPRALAVEESVGSLTSASVSVAVANLSKRYQVYDRPHHRLFQSLFRHRLRLYREFWALRSIDLTVRRGEAVGIVGRNGSGKSTLLQIIAGTLSPTSGEAVVRGRVAALLELGSGFNPQFTGRENAYLNGAILGLSRREVDDKFASIAAFADIGDFIDQPVSMFLKWHGPQTRVLGRNLLRTGCSDRRRSAGCGRCPVPGQVLRAHAPHARTRRHRASSPHTASAPYVLSARRHSISRTVA